MAVIMSSHPLHYPCIIYKSSSALAGLGIAMKGWRDIKKKHQNKIQMKVLKMILIPLARRYITRLELRLKKTIMT